MQYDLPLAELERYKPDLAGFIARDFDTFWQDTLAKAEALAAPTILTPYDAGLPLVECYDLTFSGYDGQPVRGWVLRPAGASGPLPTVIRYLGYGGGRGRPEEYLYWPCAGYVHVVMDLRGQGAGWDGGRGSTGATPDAGGDGASQMSGFLTRGIRAPETYYYRRLLTDAIRLVHAVRDLDMVNADHVVVSGASQGGVQALAAAAFAPVAAAMIDVPFLCHVMQAARMVDTAPYSEIVRYLRAHRGAEADIARTLSYVDGVGFAARCTAPALFSIALMDRVIPPRTAFAAYNHYGGEKNLVTYAYADHEGGEIDQVVAQRAFLGNL